MNRNLIAILALGSSVVASGASAGPVVGDGAASKSSFLSVQGSRFDRADADKSGVVTAEEYASVRLAQFDNADKNGDGILSRGEARGLSDSDITTGLTRVRYEQKLTQRFTSATGGDASVTRDEYLSASGKAFDNADKNDDGLLSRGEARGLTTL